MCTFMIKIRVTSHYQYILKHFGWPPSFCWRLSSYDQRLWPIHESTVRGVKESVVISISVSRRKAPVSFSCFAVWPRPKGPFTVSLILHLRNFCFNSDHLEYLSFQLSFAIGFVVVVVVVVIVIFCYLLKTKKAVS